MQVINLLTVVFYHSWFYVRYSYWCQSMFDWGDKHQFCNSQILDSFINVQCWKLDFVWDWEDMHSTLVLSNCMLIFISLLPKNVMFRKETVHFWRMEMEKEEIWGRHPLKFPKNGKTREESAVYPRLGENVPKPSHFLLLKFAGWQTRQDDGSFVVSCRETALRF